MQHLRRQNTLAGANAYYVKCFVRKYRFAIIGMDHRLDSRDLVAPKGTFSPFTRNRIFHSSPISNQHRHLKDECVSPFSNLCLGSITETLNSPEHQRLQATAKKMAEVANICSKDVQMVKITFDKLKKHGLPVSEMRVDRVTKLLVTVSSDSVCGGSVEEDELVTLLVLPEKQQWPTFRDDIKQINAAGKRIVVVKKTPYLVEGEPTESADLKLASDLLLRLLEDQQVYVLVGHPGTGKSIELNTVFLEMMKSLQSGPLKHVYHRVQGQLFHYYMDEANEKISCRVEVGIGASLSKLANFFLSKATEDENQETIGAKDTVLLFEMEENERDPRLLVATVMALSLEDVKGDQLKTMDKGGYVNYLPRPPHSATELSVLAAAIYHLNEREKTRLLKALSCPADAGVEEVLTTVSKRVKEIGPLTREVLGNARRYEILRKTMRTEENHD